MDICEHAHAKINLVLDVAGKRPDGYHELNTVFQSLMLHDTLKFSVNDGEGIVLSCSDPALPVGPENLAWRAAALLKEYYLITGGVKISLEKRIPVAAGLGGGSSDAAAVLRGLLRFWRIPVEKRVLYSLAAQLGSDVPFCLEGGTSFGRGRGEIIDSLPPLPHFFVVLANPGFALSTARVYAAYRQQPGALRPDASAMRDAILSREHDKICASLANSLESAAFSLSPQIAHLKKRMSSTAASLMCGSGPTVFTLHSSRDKALELYESLRTEGVTAWITETWAGRKLEVAVN